MKSRVSVIKEAMDRCEKLIGYWTEKWITEKDPKMRQLCYKKTQFHNKVFIELSERLIKHLEGKYGQR